MVNKIELMHDREMDDISGGKDYIKNAVGYVVDGFCALLVSSLFSGISSEICNVISDLSMDGESLDGHRESRNGTVNSFCDNLKQNVVVDFSRKIGLQALNVHNKIVDSIRKPSGSVN